MQTTVGTPAPPAPATASGTNAIATDATSPLAVYQALKQRSSVLHNQLESVLDERSEEISRLTNASGTDMETARAGIQARIAILDKRIAGLEEQISQTDAQVAVAAGVPGAVEPVRNYDDGGADEAGLFFGGMSLMAALVIVFTFIRRRMWRRRGGRPGSGNAQLNSEMATRMERLEAVAEATALEVERIGEGQRFVTKLLSEQTTKVR